MIRVHKRCSLRQRMRYLGLVALVAFVSSLDVASMAVIRRVDDSASTTGPGTAEDWSYRDSFDLVAHPRTLACSQRQTSTYCMRLGHRIVG